MNVNDGLIHLDRPAWGVQPRRVRRRELPPDVEYGHAAAAHVSAASEHVALSAARGARDGGRPREARSPSSEARGGGVAYINGGRFSGRVDEGMNEHRVRLRETVAALHAEYVSCRGMVLRRRNHRRRSVEHRAGRGARETGLPRRRWRPRTAP